LNKLITFYFIFFDFCDQRREETMKQKLTFWLIFSLLLLSFSVIGYAAQAKITAQTAASDAQATTAIDEEEQTFKQIEKIVLAFRQAMLISTCEYYRPLGDEDLKKLEKYLRDYFPLNLDPHTKVMSEEEMKKFTETSFVGIGISVEACPETTKKRLARLLAIQKEFLTEEFIKKISSHHDLERSTSEFLVAASPEYKAVRDDLINGLLDEKGIHIKGVIDGSPAEKSGLTKAYDGWYITAVGKTKTAGRQLGEMVDLIRGKKDTAVSVTLTSPDGSKTKTFTIARGSVATNRLESRIIPGTDIGYIKIMEFNVDPQDFYKACAELKKAGARALIIDLENNPGGELNSTLDIANLFVDKGQTLLYTKGRSGIYLSYKAYREKMFDWPIAVLINENSASASEVLAGIIQDYGLGTIIGVRSYGKGSAQIPRDIPADKSTIKITIAKYYLPVKKISPDGIGITPDIEIKDDPATPESETLQKAVEVLNEKLKQK